MLGLLMCVVTLIFTVSVNAYTLTMQNWGFNPSGSGEVSTGLFTPIDGITLLGLSLDNSFSSGTEGFGTFKTYGTLKATNFKNDNNVIDVSTSRINFDYEITAILETTGSYSRVTPTSLNDLIFNTGTLTLYLDDLKNYGTTSGTFGANDGTMIAKFDLAVGSGTMDFVTPVYANGRTDILFNAVYLKPGVWFDNNNFDMGLQGYDLTHLITGLTDSDNVIIPDSIIPPNFINEVKEASDLVYNRLTNYQFVVDTDGSFAPTISPVPEPATMILFGTGLIGLAKVSRKKQKLSNKL